MAPYIQICFQAFCLTPQHIYNPLPSPPVDPSWTTAVSAPYRSTFNADSNYTGDVSRQYETPLPNYGNWQQPAGSFDGIYLPPPAKKQRNDSRMSSLPQSMSNSYDQNQRGRIPQSQMGNSQGASDSYSLTPAYPSTGTAYQPPSNPVQYQYGDSSVTSYQQPTRQQSAVLRPAPTYGVPEYHQNAPATSGPQLATNTLMFPVIMSRTQDGQQVIIVQTNGGRYVDPLAVYGNNNIYAAQQSLTAATTGYPSSMPYYSGLHPTVAGLQLGDRSCQIQSNDLFSAAIVNEWQNAPVPSASTNGTATVGKRMKRKSSANNLAGIAESLQENLNVKRLRLGEH